MKLKSIQVRVTVTLLSLFFSVCIFRVLGQEKTMPASLKPFVLPGYVLLDFVEGDLNGDKKPDAILLLKSPGEDNISETDPPRPFLLLIREANGKLKQEKRNDRLVMCRHCGGVFGDPYEGISIEKNSFTISFYGGSNWRWKYDYTFTYDAVAGDWFLSKEEDLSYHTADPDKTKEFSIDQAELGVVKVEDFNVDPPFQEITWKVVSDKAYFYDNPKTGSKPRKGYLIKGDTCISYRVLKNFVQVSYESKNETFTSGFILKSNLKKRE